MIGSHEQNLHSVNYFERPIVRFISKRSLFYHIRPSRTKLSSTKLFSICLQSLIIFHSIKVAIHSYLCHKDIFKILQTSRQLFAKYSNSQRGADVRRLSIANALFHVAEKSLWVVEAFLSHVICTHAYLSSNFLRTKSQGKLLELQVCKMYTLRTLF